MKVTVKASWAERWMGGVKVKVVEGDALSALQAAVLAGIPEDEVGIAERQGVLVDVDATLKDGDAVEVYPVIIGG